MAVFRKMVASNLSKRFGIKLPCSPHSEWVEPESWPDFNLKNGRAYSSGNIGCHELEASSLPFFRRSGSELSGHCIFRVVDCEGRNLSQGSLSANPPKLVIMIFCIKKKMVAWIRWYGVSRMCLFFLLFCCLFVLYILCMCTFIMYLHQFSIKYKPDHRKRQCIFWQTV